MKMPIVLRHKCGQRLALNIEMAGKAGTCPQCGERIVVPDRQHLLKLVEHARAEHLQKREAEAMPSAAPTAPKAQPPKPAPPPQAKKPPVPPPPPKIAKPLKLEIEAPRPAAPVDKNAPKCPGCGKPVVAGAVICVNCGTNLKTGERLKTVSGAETAQKKTSLQQKPPSSPADEQKKP